MDGIKRECKLCDNIITDENFKVVEEVVKTIFDILLLKLTLDNDTQNVICTTCSSKLFEALHFKSRCLCTDNSIIPFVDFENPGPVDLKEVYIKEKGCQRGGRKLDEQEICRLCLQPMTGDCKSMQEVPVDSTALYIPEIVSNFAVTTNPVICIKCHDALCVHSTFIRNCLDVEKRRNLDVGDVLLTNTSLKTEEIEIKSEDDETRFEILCSREKEKNVKGDTSLPSQDTSINTEETESLYDVDDLKQTEESAPSVVQSDKSMERIYATTSESLSAGRKCKSVYNSIEKRNLTKQHLRQKEHSEEKVCSDRKSKKDKCDQYKFTTKQESLVVRKFKRNEYDYKCIHKGNIHRHQLRHKDRSQVRMFKCDECDYKSTRKYSLNQHQLKHKDPSEVQMFGCHECDYKSIYKSNVNSHQLTHKDPSEVRMFECNECDYKSIQKGFLKQHQLRHKDPSEVQLFECDECDYKSKQKGNLLTHQLRHKDPSQVRKFKCDICDYKTIYKNTLKLHQLRHKDPSEVRMFQCGECDYKSKQKVHLLTHQLRHKDPSELRMFKCNKCVYKSYRKNNLIKHQLCHKDPSEVPSCSSMLKATMKASLKEILSGIS